MLIKVVNLYGSIRNRVRKYYYKILYRRKYCPSEGVFARKSFHVLIEGNGKITIGRHTFFNNYCSLNCMNRITIGDNCVIGENVKLYDHSHVYHSKNVPIADQGFSTKEVCIGDNCWIGSNVTILKGTKIGNHCVIGANCLVFGEIPDNTIVRFAANNMEWIEMKG